MENKNKEAEKSFYTIEEVKQMQSEANEKYLRLAAEFDNFKRRTQREKDEIRSTTKTMMLSAILDLDSDLSIAVKQDKQNSGLNLMINKILQFKILVLNKFLNNFAKKVLSKRFCQLI